jgi:hypothetical protein
MTRIRRCGRQALVAAFLLAGPLASCGDSDSCVQVPCTSGAWLHIPLPAGGGWSAASVSVCRNAECYVAALPAVPSPDSAGASVVFTDTTDVVGILWQRADQSLVLEVEWHVGDPSQVVDGDRYVATLVDAAGQTTLLLDKTATYQPAAPDPRQCASAAPCAIADLTP